MNSPAASTPSRPAYRRRLYFVDRSIQLSLLVAIVMLEVILVAASIWLVYWQLNQVIEENLYRVHLVQGGSLFAQLAEKGLGVLGLFAVVNIIALLVAERIWSHHESHVLRNFTELITKTWELDFSNDPEPRRQVEVLVLARTWRARERLRFAAIREQVGKLEAAALAGEPEQDMRDAMESLKKLLS